MTDGQMELTIFSPINPMCVYLIFKIFERALIGEGR